MGTIKLKRGTGSPAGSLEQYEVAMDVAAKKLYVSTDGTDAVVLANEYADADAVTAIEDASSLTLTGGLTTESGLTVDAQYNANPGISYSHTLTAKRAVDGDDGSGNNTADGSGNRTMATLWRDLDSEVINTFYDNRGASLDYALTSDNGNVTQYLGGIAMQSGSDAGQSGHYIEGWSYDDGQNSYQTDTIFQANKDGFYTYGRLEAIQSATLNNRIPWDDGEGDDEAPLVVRANWEDSDAVAAEFWNQTNDEENAIILQFGTDDSAYGTNKIYNNEFRSKKLVDRKLFVMNVLNDDGTHNDTAALFGKDTNTGDIKNTLFGQTSFAQTNTSTNTDTAVYINTDMENSPVDFMNGQKINSDWKSTGIPDGAEIFQSFSFDDATIQAAGDPPHAGGFFGSLYRSANNGELSTMRLVAQTHDYTGEVELAINQKHAYSQVPFRFPDYTTTERNALTVDNGSVIYNSTTGKMQAYAGGAWVDLH